MACTIVAAAHTEIAPVKGSRFLATVLCVSDEVGARAGLEGLRAQMPDATHHCSAWRLRAPSIERASDDGEPSGSAGRPILAQLQGHDLVDAAIIVTRYYGGTKLGVGGLVRAYGAAAAAVLECAQIIPFVARIALRIKHGYPEGPQIEHALRSVEAEEIDVAFEQEITREVTVAVDREAALREAIRDASRGRALVQQLDR